MKVDSLQGTGGQVPSHSSVTTHAADAVVVADVVDGVGAAAIDVGVIVGAGAGASAAVVAAVAVFGFVVYGLVESAGIVVTAAGQHTCLFVTGAGF